MQRRIPVPGTHPTAADAGAFGFRKTSCSHARLRTRATAHGADITATFSVTINEQKHRVTAPPDMPLLWVLRDLLQLTGTKYGCGVGVCGSCAILHGRIAVRACQIPISEADGKSYTTIEGLSATGEHPCQEAWIEEDAAQCGYCQPGMIITAAALLMRHPTPTDADIDTAISNSVCRCGTYQRMCRAIHRAARQRRGA